ARHRRKHGHIIRPLFQRPALRRAAPWLLLAATSTLLGLFFTTQAYANPEVRRLLSFRRALWINLTYYWFWGAAVPLVVALVKRWRFEGGRWKRALGVHVLANVLLSAVIVVLTEAVLTQLLGIHRSPLGENTAL